jgi:hypothetical protein
MAEGLNSTIQELKVTGKGYRNLITPELPSFL